MKHITACIIILIQLLLWLIIMIPSFIIRFLWEFNPNNYDFKYNHDYYVRKCFPLIIPSFYSNEYYTYDSFFHYLFNIKHTEKKLMIKTLNI